MKKIIYLLFAFTLFLGACSNSDTKEGQNNADSTVRKLGGDGDTVICIGHIDGDTITFTNDSSTLKSDWENFLNEGAETTVSLNHIYFVTTGSAYYLAVYGTKGTENVRSMMVLQQGTNPNALFVTSEKTTCTTTDCSDELNGCLPVLTACTPCGNKGKCTKSISNALTIFPNVPAVAMGTCL